MNGYKWASISYPTVRFGRHIVRNKPLFIVTIVLQYKVHTAFVR